MRTLYQFPKITTILLFASILSFEAIGQQQCRVTRDSIVAGTDAGWYKDYIYDGTGRLAQVIHRDDFGNEYRADFVTYDAGSNMIATVKSVDLNDTIREKNIEYIINGGRIVRVNLSNDSSGVTLDAVSHDVNYSGSNVSSIVVDQNSITGNPDFPASFINMVWQNGNIASLSLVFGTDTLQMAITYDSNDNIAKKLLNTDGASGIFLSASANNLISATTSADGNLFGNNVPQGTILLDREYTYNSNNDVETIRNKDTLFEDDETTKFNYNCPTSIRNLSAINIAVYPNPATDFIQIENGYFLGTVAIFDVRGKEIRRMEAKDQIASLNISDLAPGMYYIEIAKGQELFRGKVMKQ